MQLCILEHICISVHCYTLIYRFVYCYVHVYGWFTDAHDGEAADDDDEEEQVRGKRGRNRQDRFPFLPQHPQHATHEMVLRTVEVIPVPIGPNIPLQADQPVEFAFNMLARYMPHRTPADLLDMGATWPERLAAFNRRTHSAYVQVHMFYFL